MQVMTRDYPEISLLFKLRNANNDQLTRVCTIRYHYALNPRIYIKTAVRINAQVASRASGRVPEHVLA